MLRRSLARVIGIAGFVVALAVGVSAPANAVANGVDALPDQFPYAVKLTMTDIPRPDGSKYNSACSAGLVAPQWIVTAGHCFHDVNRNPVSGPTPYKTTATLGKVDLADQGGVVVDVVEVRQAGVNDVALAKLSRPVYGIGTLRVGRHTPAVGEELVLAGWGATDSVNPTPGTHLRYGVVAVGALTATTAAVHGVWPKDDTSACTYDSGAPYFSYEYGVPTLVAVESDGPDCPHPNAETTSRVDLLTDWICQQIGH
ncbi:trypsin-like serine protease [Solihabitans fulvus]|uniref:Trypsin-like serine protease n=1 Tax=Solihabitans fulvus TaxID=1892852 RepID=A0A5B2XE87_9PSEU|nr:trypsin-like serine protease [Solihabitans fulvus]KAA2261271.1 trypsin-like serine protease [Solihabitans fulvus]